MAERTANLSLPPFMAAEKERAKVGEKTEVPGESVPEGRSETVSFSSSNWVFTALRRPPMDWARASMDL